MVRYLMDYCINYESETCQPKIKNARRATEIKNGKIPLWPSGKEQEELDKICERCALRYFKISEYVCPVCHGEEFSKEVKVGRILNDQEKPKAEVTVMECTKCKSKLKLVEEL